MNGRITFDAETREDVEALCTLIVGLCMHTEGFIASGEILTAIDADAKILADLLDSVAWSSKCALIISFLPHNEAIPIHFLVSEFSQAIAKKEIT